jgi:hypothetical protein
MTEPFSEEQKAPPKMNELQEAWILFRKIIEEQRRRDAEALYQNLKPYADALSGEGLKQK